MTRHPAELRPKLRDDAFRTFDTSRNVMRLQFGVMCLRLDLVFQATDLQSESIYLGIFGRQRNVGLIELRMDMHEHPKRG